MQTQSTTGHAPGGTLPLFAAKTPRQTQLQSQYYERIKAILADIRVQLSDGDWHMIKVVELCTVHSVNNNVFRVLERLRCIECRPTKMAYRSRSHDYRRLSGLNQITVQTIVAEKLRMERDKAQRVKLKSKSTVAEPLAQDSFPAVEPETVPDALAELSSFDEPQPEPGPQYLLLQLGEQNVIFGSRELVFDSVDQAATGVQQAEGKTYIVAQIVEVVRPIIHLERSKAL